MVYQRVLPGEGRSLQYWEALPPVGDEEATRSRRTAWTEPRSRYRQVPGAELDGLHLSGWPPALRGAAATRPISSGRSGFSPPQGSFPGRPATYPLEAW